MRFSAITRRIKRNKSILLAIILLSTTAYFSMDLLYYTTKEVGGNPQGNTTHVIPETISTPQTPNYHCKHGRSLTNIQKNISSHFTLFEPFIEPNMTCEDREIYLPILVNSAATGDRHRRLRDTIRQTWGNPSTYSGDKRWRLFFSLGLCKDSHENELNKQEALKNNDVIIGNFSDIYGHLVNKTFMGMSWAYSRLTCQYFMKTDDDVYVRIPKVIEWLINSGSPTPFYGGFIAVGYHVFRDPKSINYISKEQYNETDWPPFALGAFEIFDNQSIPWYLNYTQYIWPFRTDDTYLAVAARDFGIRAVHIPGFRILPKKDCDLLNGTAIGYSLDSSTIHRYHDFFTEKNNAKRKCLGLN